MDLEGVSSALGGERGCCKVFANMVRKSGEDCEGGSVVGYFLEFTVGVCGCAATPGFLRRGGFM